MLITTGPLGELRESPPEELELYPADTTGNNFVCRSHEGDPWTALSFGVLGDGRPQLYLSGRVTPRTGDAR